MTIQELDEKIQELKKAAYYDPVLPVLFEDRWSFTDVKAIAIGPYGPEGQRVVYIK